MNNHLNHYNLQPPAGRYYSFVFVSGREFNTFSENILENGAFWREGGLSRDRHFNLYRFRIFNPHLDLSRNEISWKRGRIENYEKNSITLFRNGFLAEISVHHDMDLKYPVAGGRVWQKEQSQPNPDRIAMV